VLSSAFIIAIPVDALPNLCDDEVSRQRRAQTGSFPMSGENLDEKIVKKKSIPAQIVFWIVIIVALCAFYKAFSGHPSH
jgi:hypothetical protein